MNRPDTPRLDSATPPGDCVLFATADWDTPYWTNKQHTAAHLAKAGWRVLYVESVGLRAPKIGSGTDWSRIARRLWRGLRGPRKVADGIWVYAPLVIPFRHDHAWVRAFNQGFLSRMIGWFMQRQVFRLPMVWTYHPYVLETLDWLNRQPGTATGPLVYHCVDDLATIPGIDAKAFLQEERALLKKASAVFTTAQALYNKCSEHNSNVHNYPNVADFEHFAQAHDDGPIPEDLASIPKPRLVYMGALSDFKVNFDLLHKVAADRPDWHIVLIGSEREGQQDTALAALSSLPNVHLLGHRPYQQLPGYLRGMCVGLLPTHVNEYTRSMFPMKYFEYLAAGLPVVSTPLAFTSHHQDGLLVAQDPSSFSAALERQLASGHLQIGQSREMVGLHTWDARLAAMLAQVSPPSEHREQPHQSLTPQHSPTNPQSTSSGAAKAHQPE